MSSREAILGRIRQALADVPDRPAEVDVPVDWEYGLRRMDAATDVLALFVERVEDYRALVSWCTPEELPQRIANALTDHGAGSVVLPAGVPAEWAQAIERAGIELHSDEPPLSHAQLDAIGGVVTGSVVGIALTGTLVLDHGPDQGRRALSLVPDLHVCVLRADQVVSDVPEAVARLQGSVDERRPLTWISGPSATSDIELSRVEGVHGPRTLHVMLVQ